MTNFQLERLNYESSTSGEYTDYVTAPSLLKRKETIAFRGESQNVNYVMFNKSSQMIMKLKFGH